MKCKFFFILSIPFRAPSQEVRQLTFISFSSKTNAMETYTRVVFEYRKEEYKTPPPPFPRGHAPICDLIIRKNPISTERVERALNQGQCSFSNSAADLVSFDSLAVRDSKLRLFRNQDAIVSAVGQFMCAALSSPTHRNHCIRCLSAPKTVRSRVSSGGPTSRRSRSEDFHHGCFRCCCCIRPPTYVWPRTFQVTLC